MGRGGNLHLSLELFIIKLETAKKKYPLNGLTPFQVEGD